MKKQLNYVDIIKETVVLTWAVAIIAAAVYFFLVPRPEILLTEVWLGTRKK